MLQAARLRIYEKEFWSLSPKALDRRFAAHEWREKRRGEEMKHQEEARHYNTLNAFGSVMIEDWEWVSPPEEGSEGPLRLEEREQRALEREREYIEKLHGAS